MDVSISTQLSANGGGDKRAIKRALRQRPDTAREASLKSAICEIEPISDGLRVTVKLTIPKVGRKEVVSIETADPSIWVSEVSSLREGGVLTTVSELVPSSSKPFFLNRSDLRMTVLADGRGVDIRGCTGG